MAPPVDRSKKANGERRPKKPVRKFKKQKNYHSSSESESEDDGQDQDQSIRSTTKGTNDHDEQDQESVEISGDSDGSASDASNSADESAGDRTKKRKRNDPSVLSSSISKILSAKLSTSQRADPVLARSAAATAASKEVIDARLEAKARKKINAEKRRALDKGRVQDVLGLQSTEVSTSDIQELEKRLKKTAQRGVVKLFNAVRAAQVQGDVARAEARQQGVVGMGQRDERVGEMSKQGFLDLIKQGGQKTTTVAT